MRKRKALAMFLVPIMCLTVIPVKTFALNLPIYVNGKKASIPNDQQPYVNKDNRTMMSIRGISDSLGYKVSWKSSNSTVEVVYGSKKVVLPLNSKTVYIDGKATTIDTKTETVNGRVFVPLRFVSQTFGANVKYNGTSNKVEIETMDAFYVVQKGDTLYSVATKYKTTVAVLKKLNNLKTDSIKVGQKLVVNGNVKVENEVEATITYTVVSGDTLSSVAKKYNVTVDSIKQANKLTKDTIYVGQKLVIKGGQTSGTTKPPVDTTKKAKIVVNGTLNVRSGAGTSYGIKGTLTNGTIVTVGKTSGSWAYITYGSLVGWVHTDYITYDLTSSTGTLSGKIIVLDPGHGGSDPGSIGVDKTPEKTLALSYATSIKKELEAMGATVYMTRTSDTRCGNVWDNDTNGDLKCRTDYAKAQKGDIFISVHFNWFYGGTGTETYYNETNTYDGTVNPYPTQSKRLAQLVHKYYRPAINLPDRGVQNANYYVNRRAVMPSILMEVGFISNSTDLSRIKTSSVQTQVAKGVAKGVNEYFNN